MGAITQLYEFHTAIVAIKTHTPEAIHLNEPEK
jgi:hypothetical protein